MPNVITCFTLTVPFITDFNLSIFDRGLSFICSTKDLPSRCTLNSGILPFSYKLTR
jgi:hypothetical protein